METTTSRGGTADEIIMDEIDEYFRLNGKGVINFILNMKYKPKPVRRVYIPKTDGNKRSLLSFSTGFHNVCLSL